MRRATPWGEGVSHGRGEPWGGVSHGEGRATLFPESRKSMPSQSRKSRAKVESCPRVEKLRESRKVEKVDYSSESTKVEESSESRESESGKYLLRISSVL